MGRIKNGSDYSFAVAQHLEMRSCVAAGEAQLKAISIKYMSKFAGLSWQW
jgi:hypothetical protein